MKIQKSNIEIIKSYVNNERPFVTVGYVPPNIQRKEGEVWTDNDGKKWTQKNGYKSPVHEQTELIRTQIQQKCKCGQNIKYGTRLDEKFFWKTGKCFDCIIKEETRLRILGVFPQYENYKLISNYLGNLEDIKRQIQDSIRYLKNEDGELKIVCNSEGFLEKFTGLNTTELLIAARKDLKEINGLIKKIRVEKRKIKSFYITEYKKALAMAKTHQK